VRGALQRNRAIRLPCIISVLWVIGVRTTGDL
jgi:hypothetical protein